MPRATKKAEGGSKPPKLQQHLTRKFYWIGYKSARWKRQRKEFLNDSPLCVECEKENKVKPAVVVDHIKPIEDGADPWDRSNWQGLCWSHDASKRGSTKRKRGRG